jgi:uncharacterized protein (TIGR03000 family)
MTRLGAVGLASLAVLLGCLAGRLASAQDSPDSGTLLVVVPEDAKVVVNDKPTRVTGTERKFQLPGMEPGFEYDYRVHVEVVREGKTLSEDQTAHLQAGRTVRLVFGLPAAPEAKPGVKPKEPPPAAKPTEKSPSWQPSPPAKAKDAEPGAKTPGPPAKGVPGASPPLEGPGANSPEKKPTAKPGEKTPPAAPGAKIPDATPGVKTPSTNPPEKKGLPPLGPEKPGLPPVGPEKPGVPGMPGPVGPVAPIDHKIPLVEKYLVAGRLADAETDLATRLRENSRDDETRASLGVVQVIRAVERLSQAMYRHGFGTPDLNVSGVEAKNFRLLVPRNPKPMPLNYLQAREILKEFVGDLEKADATLAEISDKEIKLPLHLGLIRVDLVGDGKFADDFWRLYGKLSHQPNLRESDAKAFLVSFDYGDVLWLRGYCHLAMAVGETILAYDEQDLFEWAGNLLFAQPVSPHPFLITDPEKLRGQPDPALVVALQHLFRFKLEEPERMARAAKHLRTALDMSRQSWKAILAETDDDNEWIPNPNQQGAIRDFPVKPEMVDAWLKALAEADAIMAGKKLVPRVIAPPPGDDRGINVNQFFAKPPATFDLILWLQGAGTIPYLEKGTMTDPKVWQRLQDVFGDDLLWYVLWFS